MKLQNNNDDEEISLIYAKLKRENFITKKGFRKSTFEKGNGIREIRMPGNAQAFPIN